VTGRLFVEVIDNYCAVLNHGGIPNIQTCMDQIFKSEADRSYQSKNLNKLSRSCFWIKLGKLCLISVKTSGSTLNPRSKT